jgi:hypothetical protein
MVLVVRVAYAPIWPRLAGAPCHLIEFRVNKIFENNHKDMVKYPRDIKMKYKELSEKIKSALKAKQSNASEPRAHSYAAQSRMPQQIPTHSTPVKKERQTNIVSKEWNSEVKHTSAYSSQLETHHLPGADLIPARVHRWNIKNYSAIVRKMKSHIKTKEADMTSKVSHITSSDQAETAHAEKKQDDLWRDMMKNNEERQFHITRITNFFT